MVDFGEAITRGFSKAFTFTGRASRSEYWWWMLFCIVSGIAVGFIDGLLVMPLLGLKPSNGDFQPFTIILVLSLIVPSISLAVRRMHDVGWTGFMVLIPLIPILGSIIYFVLTVWPGTAGPNKYGIRDNGVAGFTPDAARYDASSQRTALSRLQQSSFGSQGLPAHQAPRHHSL